MAHGTDPHALEEGGTRGGLDRYLGPVARYHSHMPENLVDGEVAPDDAPEDNNLSHEQVSADEAAERLRQMQQGSVPEDGRVDTNPPA